MGLPLVLANSKLYSLTDSEPYIEKSLHGNMNRIVQQLGFIVVDEVYSGSQKYVQDFDPEGVLKCITCIPGIFRKVEQLQESDKVELREFLSTIKETKQKEVLIRLPIFQTFPTVCEAGRWLSVSESSESASGYSGEPIVELPQGTFILDLHRDSVKRLASTIGTTVITDEELFTKYILSSFDKYSDENKVRIITHALANLENYSCIKETLKQLQCIPTTSGEFKRPNELYDPADSKIQNLFGEFNLLPFPKHPFTKPITLAKLQELGMCGIDEIKADQLFKLAQYIDKIARRNEDEIKIRKQGKYFAEFLNKHASLLILPVSKNKSVTSLKVAISDFRFIPFTEGKPFDDIPWFQDDLCLVKPSAVSTHCMLVGSQMPTPECAYSELAEAYGWSKLPQGDTVLRHLKALIDSHTDGNSMPACLTTIYDYLQTEIDNVDNSAAITEGLANMQNWIWNGSGFVKPSHVVFSSDRDLDAAPYMYVCMPALQRYRQLFAAAGVNEHANWCNILQRIRDYNDDNPKHEDVQRDKNIVLAILRKVAVEGPLTDDLLIPIACSNMLILKPRRNCTFCVTKWMQRGRAEVDIVDLGKDIHIIHPDISLTLANDLGVPSFTSTYLNADELDLSYGQTEKLTHRIHTILEDYKDGLAVFKELLQNADDAGATEVAFIHDRRNMESSSETLLDENMTSLQGPAIWVYNDAVFSDDDFENIVKLSGATKKDQTTKIGRFGLGFNAVYHLTDVPSFVSRENIVFFDPHTSYLGHSLKNPSKPGIRLHIKKHSSRIEFFCDQFKPYHGLFGVDMTSSFDGTLFRLPLRTKDQAEKSEISSKVYDDSEVRSLFDLLYNEAEALLLFTQCVRKVTVYDIEENKLKSPALKQRFVIERGIKHMIKSMFPNIKDESKILHSFQNANRSLREHYSNCYITKVTISDELNDRENTKTRVSHWVIYNAIGNGAAKQLAEEKEELCVLPVGGVACRLQYNTEISKYYPEMLKKNESQVFCVFPFPIRYELPVHVNGYFSVTSNRIHLHGDEKSDKPDVRALWNRTLMEDAVATAYLDLLCQMLRSDMFDHDHLLSDIFNFYPLGLRQCVEGQNHPAFCLMKSFLEQLFHCSGKCILPSGNQWTDGSNFVSLHRNAKDSAIGQQMTAVCKIIFNGSLESPRFVDLPYAIYNDLESCNLLDRVSSQLISVESFYSDCLLPKLHLVPTDMVENVILHAMTECNQRYDHIMAEYDCVPVSGGDKQQFKRPGILVDPESSLARLFDTQEGYFPLPLMNSNEKWLKEQWRSALLRLGMRDGGRQTLTNTEVLQRAKSVEQITDEQAAVRRSECLLTLLDQLPDSDIQELSSALKDIAFIVKTECPENWTLPWKGNQFGQYLLLDQIYEENYEFMGVVCPLPKFENKQQAHGLLKHLKSRMNMELNLQTDYILTFMTEVHNLLQKENTSGMASSAELIEKLTESCYEWANKNACPKEFNKFREIPFLIIKNSQKVLVKPIKCVKYISGITEPFIYRLPSRFDARYKKLVDALHIQKEGKAKDFVAV